jgi:hypothetical protein
MKNFILLLVLSATCLAQEAPCGLTSIKETTPLLYPPIARAAHVGGMVIFLVSFKLNGEVEDVQVLSGPKLLQTPATAYVKGLHANEYGGTRTCPIVVRYVIQPEGLEADRIDHIDIQHVTIYAKSIVISDPEMYIEKPRKRFWPFHTHKPKHLD